MPRQRLIGRWDGWLPEWAKQEPNIALASLAEDVYMARALALDAYQADKYQICREPLRAGEKELAVLANVDAVYSKRKAAGERAYGKFVVAKDNARTLRNLATAKPKRERT